MAELPADVRRLFEVAAFDARDILRACQDADETDTRWMGRIELLSAERTSLCLAALVLMVVDAPDALRLFQRPTTGDGGDVDVVTTFDRVIRTYPSPTRPRGDAP